MPNLFYVHGTKNLVVNVRNQNCKLEPFEDSGLGQDRGLSDLFRRTFPDVGNIFRFSWNGNLKNFDRRNAAEILLGCMEPGDIAVAHSHGGNVVLEALTYRKLDNVRAYLFATPVMERFNIPELFSRNVIYEYYSSSDSVQTTCARFGNVVDMSRGGTTCLGLRSYSANRTADNEGRARELIVGYSQPHLDMNTMLAFTQAFAGHM